MPLSFALRVVAVDEFAAVRRQLEADKATSASGTCASGACNCSVQLLLARACASAAAFSSTRISSPLLMTPMRSAISSASSI